jgi:hypothetical protein
MIKASNNNIVLAHIRSLGRAKPRRAPHAIR